jgi:hypothetical protein
MIRLTALAILLGACLGCIGCEPPGPTYSEALQNYTAEMQELQRLRTEREKIEQAGSKVEVDLAALLTKPLDLAGQNLDLLKPGTDLLKQGGALDKMIDRAAQEAEFTKWREARAKNGERLNDATAETEAVNAERKRLGLPIISGVDPQAAAYQAEQAKTKDRDKSLAEIDKQIAVQQERVDRARALKDKIEASKY